jgi:hypothetical protein
MWRTRHRAKKSGIVEIPVGGVYIGDPGATGTMYEGYTLSWGDEFNGLDIISPSGPRGKWLTTRTYGPGARGSDTLLSTMFDTDPYFTGHNDSNRGVPVGYNNMSVSGSVLSLQARKATAGEQTHMYSTRNEVAAMISGAGAVHWYPGTAGTQDIIYEANIKFSTNTGNPLGWHPTLWLLSLNPTISFQGDELDWEGNSDRAKLNRNVWTSGSQTSESASGTKTHDGQFHVISYVINTTEVKIYVDGTLFTTGAWNGNSKSKPQYPLITSHIYNGTYDGETYSQASWDADSDGATLSVDWVRVWRRTGKSHFSPLITQSDTNVDYGSSTTITLPSAITIWGDATVTEYLQVIPTEENEPGVTHSALYTQFPTGVSYNSGTRQITVNITSGKTGRLNFALSAWKADGSTGEPLRFAVNVGPSLSFSTLTLDDGEVTSYDVYAACDCGVLTSNGVTKSKTITVTGLSGSGLSYSDATGLITGTAVAGTYTATVTCTNSVGQSKSASLPITVNVVGGFLPTDLSGLQLWLDADDAASITSSAGLVSQWNDKSGNNRHATQSSSSAKPTTGTRTINSKNAIDFDGATDFIKTSSRIFTAPSARTYIVVTKTDNAQPGTGTARLVSERFSGGALIGTKTTNQFNFLHDYNTTGSFLRRSSVDNSIDTTNPWILVCTWGGTSTSSGVHLYKDGSPEVSYSIDTNGTGTGVNADSTGLSIGASIDNAGAVVSNTYYDGLISEILIYNRVLTASELNQIGVYLEGKWGITWTSIAETPGYMTWSDLQVVQSGNSTPFEWST